MKRNYVAAIVLVSCITLVLTAGCNSTASNRQTATDSPAVQAPTDPATSAPKITTWSEKATLISPLSKVAALDDMIYMFGGDNGAGVNRPDIHAYDIQTNQWIKKQAKLPIPSSNEVIVAVPYDGKIYLGAHCDLVLHVYDPSTDTISSTSPMPQAVQEFQAAEADGKIYVIGGAIQDTMLGTIPSNKVFRYDPATDQWAVVASLTTPRINPRVASWQGMIFAVGGNSVDGWLYSVEAYDPSSDTWSPKADCPVSVQATSVTEAEGMIYIVGAMDPANKDDHTFICRYDIVGDTWIRLTGAQTKFLGQGIAFNGRLYTVGCGNPGESQNHLIEYGLNFLTPCDITTQNQLHQDTNNDAYAKELPYQKDTKNFIFHCDTGDEQSIRFIEDLAESFTSNYMRINEDLDFEGSEKVNVFIWPTLSAFHNAMNQPDAGSWFRGTTGNNAVYTVSPSGLGGLSLESTILHEYTHVLINSINTGRIPRWLDEGVASYEGGEMSKSMIKSTISSRTRPTLADLNDETKNFTSINGYEFSYTVVDFIVQTYGRKSLVQFIKNPASSQEIFKTDAVQFEKNWADFIERNYQ